MSFISTCHIHLKETDLNLYPGLVKLLFNSIPNDDDGGDDADDCRSDLFLSLSGFRCNVVWIPLHQLACLLFCPVLHCFPLFCIVLHRLESSILNILQCEPPFPFITQNTPSFPLCSTQSFAGGKILN